MIFAQGKQETGFCSAVKKEPHTIQLSIKLWQPVQPEQTQQTNQKTACTPKNETQEVVVLSNQPQQHTNKKYVTDSVFGSLKEAFFVNILRIQH